MDTDTRPSIFRIIVTNYLSFIAALTPLFLWFFFLVDQYRGNTLSTLDFQLLVGLTVVCIIVLIWKIMEISTTIRHGQEIKAVIHSSGFYRGRGQIKFIYTYQGEKYQNSNVVMKNSRTRDFATGDEIVIYINPNDPRISVIKDIYIQ